MNVYDFDGGRLRVIQGFFDHWGDSRSVSALAVGDLDGVRRGMLLWKETADLSQPFQTALEFGHIWGDDRYVTALAFQDLNADGVPDIGATGATTSACSSWGSIRSYALPGRWGWARAGAIAGVAAR